MCREDPAIYWKYNYLRWDESDKGILFSTSSLLTYLIITTYRILILPAFKCQGQFNWLNYKWWFVLRELDMLYGICLKKVLLFSNALRSDFTKCRCVHLSSLSCLVLNFMIIEISGVILGLVQIVVSFVFYKIMVLAEWYYRFGWFTSISFCLNIRPNDNLH